MNPNRHVFTVAVLALLVSGCVTQPSGPDPLQPGAAAITIETRNPFLPTGHLHVRENREPRPKRRWYRIKQYQVPLFTSRSGTVFLDEALYGNGCDSLSQ